MRRSDRKKQSDGRQRPRDIHAGLSRISAQYAEDQAARNASPSPDSVGAFPPSAPVTGQQQRYRSARLAAHRS